MTAAETAPSPKKDTKSGVRYCNTIGKIILVSFSVNGHGPVYPVSFHAANFIDKKTFFLFSNNHCVL